MTGAHARITFAIPYAGGSRAFLSAAIDSVRAQTIPAWKLIVVDDSAVLGDVRATIEGYGDERIAYVRNDGAHGIAEGWNACLRDTDTEFLTILHADDELEPDYAREMLALADRHPNAALCYCAASIVDERGREKFSLADAFKTFIAPRADETEIAGARAIAALSVGNFIVCPTVLYRMSSIAGRAFSNRYRFMLDLDFVIERLLESAAIAGTRRTLFRYRRHAVQQTAILDRETVRVDEERAFYEDLARRLRGGPYRDAAGLARLRLSTRLSAAVSALGDLRAGRFGLARKKGVSCVRW